MKYVAVQEPIDFDLLAKAYKEERWRWTDCGYPRPQDLRLAVARLSVTAKKFGYCSSGGLEVRREVEVECVAIDANLSAWYEAFLRRQKDPA